MNKKEGIIGNLILELNVKLQKARDGRDYIQIMSDDYTTINIVLIATKINITDERKGGLLK